MCQVTRIDLRSKLAISARSGEGLSENA